MGRVVEHRIKRVECRREAEDFDRYTLSYHIEISSRRVEGKVLKLAYGFHAYYKDEVGEVTVEGELSYEDTAKALKDIDKSWEKNLELQQRIYNLILRSSITLVMDLTRHVGLPPPIAMPELKVEDGGLKA